MIHLYVFVTNSKTQTNAQIHKVTGILKTHAWGKSCKYIDPVKNCGKFDLTPLKFSGMQEYVA